MRLRNRPWAAKELSVCPYYLKDFSRFTGRWSEAFGNNNPIWLELGCGKGLFISGMAPQHPELNFVGADIKSLMLAYARRNIEEAFSAIGKPVDNVLLLSVDVERILNSFSETDKVERIIINFCNPWPKPKHHKKRLTHIKQLVNYKVFLIPNGIIEFKTDDDALYYDSLEYFKQAGYTIEEHTFDYYSDHELIDSILTEHERKFISESLPIHYIKAVNKK